MHRQITVKQDGRPCWQLGSGGSRNETASRVRSFKRRKKRDKLVDRTIKLNVERSSSSDTYLCILFSVLPRMIVFTFLIMPIILLSNFPLPGAIRGPNPALLLSAEAQLIVDHPKSRNQWVSLSSSSSSYQKLPVKLFPSPPYARTPSDEQTLAATAHPIDYSSPSKLIEGLHAGGDLNITDLAATLPISKDQRNELLHKLSSSMLLKILLRNPLPSINKSPFPPLPLPILKDFLSQTNETSEVVGLGHDDFRPTRSPNRTSQSVAASNKPLRVGLYGTRRKQLPQQPTHRSAAMETAGTNNTIVTENENSLVKMNETLIAPLTSSDHNSAAKVDTFNASSLNYLVDRLLNVNSFKSPPGIGGGGHHNHQQKRPSSREKLPHEANIIEIVDEQQLKQDSKFPSPGPRNHTKQTTLDMLIKDEYDSRVKPMIKSLMDQERLSTTPNNYPTTPVAGPTNHRLTDESTADSFATTTVGPFDDDDDNDLELSNTTTTISPSTPYISTTTNAPPTTTKVIISTGDQNILVSFDPDKEDNEESAEEDENEFDDGGEAKEASKTTPQMRENSKSTKKILQNVPPYQLSNNFGTQLDSNTKTTPKSYKTQLDTQATTMSSANNQATPGDNDSRADDSERNAAKQDINSGSGDRAADASSVRGSLVFSDGADEAERANKRREQSNRAVASLKNNTNKVGDYSSSQAKKKNWPNQQMANDRNDRVGESFLLNQLLSTVNPLSDLELKLKARPHIKDMPDLSPNNPLIYKGYVGKDDYLLSSTAGDWSQPINSRTNAMTTMYKYLYNNMAATTTTPAPSTEPPSVPYNYFLNQPVTNAQSVPSMVIPTSDPIIGFTAATTSTTRAPTTSMNQIQRKMTLQPPRVGGPLSHNHHHHHHQLVTNYGQNFLPVMNKLATTIATAGGGSGSNQDDRRYSYQIPDKPNRNQVHHAGNRHLSSNPYPHVSMNNSRRPVMLLGDGGESGETRLHSNNSKGRNESLPSSKFANGFDRNWSPTKIGPNENDPLTSNQKHHQQQATNYINFTDTEQASAAIESNSMNSGSSPRLVPTVDRARTTLPLSANTTTSNQSSQGKVPSPLDSSDDIHNSLSAAAPPPMSTEEQNTLINDDDGRRNKESEHNAVLGREPFSHATDKRPTNAQRNKFKSSVVDTTPNTTSTETTTTSGINENAAGSSAEMGDTDSESEIRNHRDESSQGSRPMKRPPASSGGSGGGLRVRNERPSAGRVPEPDILHDYQSESDGGYDGGGDAAANYRQKNSAKKRQQQQQSEEQQTRVAMMKQNQTTRKGVYLINHEPAGSEISLSGLDKNHHHHQLQSSNNRRRNQTTTSRFTHSTANNSNKQQQTPGMIGSIIITNSSPSSTASSSTTDDASVPTSFVSTIIPNSNFFGDASSESPTLDNSIAIMNGGGGSGNKINNKHPSLTTEDPYQRTSSTNVLSTVQQPSSPGMMTPAPKLPTSTVQVTTSSGGGGESTTSASGPGPAKPSSAKGTSDRLAFILIGGSCALSVVCLILAAMSMRCQDMCDDYRSLRNAERAALKLQKHRLKYTKNHQINRFNHGRRQAAGSSPDTGRAGLIDDLSRPNDGSVESEINQQQQRMKSSKCLNSAKPSIQFRNDNKNNNTDLNLWNPLSQCQVPFPALIHKEQQSCRCANCSSAHRWPLCQDDIMVGSKHFSWLHPYYYMQHHPRLRPLFGAGSSVGTFFPRRVDDQGYQGGGSGGSTDAQILIDSQPPHSCVIDQRGVTRSKSIVYKNKSNQLHPNRHANGFETSAGGDAAAPNFGCNNPDHNHSHHVCHTHLPNHHHHHHNHGYNMETSGSEESEPTTEESVQCCDGAKCSNHNLHNRLRLTQPKSSGLNHHLSGGGGGWKAEPSGREGANHHHHRQQHQQQVAGSDGSSIARCTCSHDQQPLVSNANGGRQQNSRTHNKTTNHHKHQAYNKHDSRDSFKNQAKRDKSMLIWSTNRDRLI